MINVNDLIGLQYKWGEAPANNSGYTDCFQLACEVHKRLGLHDYTQQFEWVYAQYDEATFPRRLLVRWLRENGTRCYPQEGAVTLLPTTTGSALGTFLDATSILFIGPDSHVIRSAVPSPTPTFAMNR